MIRVNDDWVVDVDDFCYSLKRDMHKDIVRKNGTVEHKYKVFGYYNTLEKALNSLYEQLNKETLQQGLHSLSEAITTIKNNRERWEELVDKVLHEVN